MRRLDCGSVVMVDWISTRRLNGVLVHDKHRVMLKRVYSWSCSMVAFINVHQASISKYFSRSFY